MEYVGTWHMAVKLPIYYAIHAYLQAYQNFLVSWFPWMKLQRWESHDEMVGEESCCDLSMHVQ